MVGLISIIIIIVISFAMMMEGWEKYDSQKFYTGLLVIGISIIMIFPIMQYNMENMKNVYKFKKLNEMLLKPIRMREMNAIYCYILGYCLHLMMTQ